MASACRDDSHSLFHWTQLCRDDRNSLFNCIQLCSNSRHSPCVCAMLCSEGLQDKIAVLEEIYAQEDRTPRTMYTNAMRENLLDAGYRAQVCERSPCCCELGRDFCNLNPNKVANRMVFAMCLVKVGATCEVKINGRSRSA